VSFYRAINKTSRGGAPNLIPPSRSRGLGRGPAMGQDSAVRTNVRSAYYDVVTRTLVRRTRTVFSPSPIFIGAVRISSQPHTARMNEQEWQQHSPQYSTPGSQRRSLKSTVLT
jgi:hypothetical protein